jgi:tetratricopeptide (TPR) repeat protein
MTPHTRTCATLMVVMVALATSVPAAAAGVEEQREARRNFQAGEAHFKAGRYDEALAAYQEGYAAVPLPGFLINVAQCQRRLGDLAKARATYEKFLFVAPDSPLVPEVKKLIAELDQMLTADLAVETPTSPSPDLSAPAPTEPVATMVTVEARATPAPDRPLWKRWWLWGAVGAAVAAGTVTAFALSSSAPATIHEGSLGTLRR